MIMARLYNFSMERHEEKEFFKRHSERAATVHEKFDRNQSPWGRLRFNCRRPLLKKREHFVRETMISVFEAIRWVRVKDHTVVIKNDQRWNAVSDRVAKALDSFGVVLLPIN